MLCKTSRKVKAYCSTFYKFNCAIARAKFRSVLDALAITGLARSSEQTLGERRSFPTISRFIALYRMTTISARRGIRRRRRCTARFAFPYIILRQRTMRARRFDAFCRAARGDGERWAFCISTSYWQIVTVA